MLIIEWAPITETETIPPFGIALAAHLNNLNGAVKHASCSAWNLLAQTLLDNSLPLADVIFTTTGKPLFLNSNLHFSISHSRGICTIAVADRPIGVDVEKIRTDYNAHLIEHSLTENEKRVFDGDFTHIWCRKEAVAKMTGAGIVGYPRDIDTTSYIFHEQQIDWNGQKYWLVVV